MPTTVTLNYAGGRQWYRVPSSVISATVNYTLVGGGGGGGGADSQGGGNGGGACRAEGVLTVKGNDLIELFIGENGKHSITTPGSGSAIGGNGGKSLSGYGGGAGGRAGPTPWSGGGGGGGGASALRVNGKIVAIGGGGAGGAGAGNRSGGESGKNYPTGASSGGSGNVLPIQNCGSWGSFLNSYAVWHVSGSDNDYTDYYVYFPTTQSYTATLSADNFGQLLIDGTEIIRTQGEQSAFQSTWTGATTVAAGIHIVRIYANNWGGPRGFGATLRGADNVTIWTTRDATKPYNTTLGETGASHGGDGGGGGGGGGGSPGGNGGAAGGGDNGGTAGGLGRPIAIGGTVVTSQYSDQRLSSYPTTNGDGGTGATGFSNNGTDGVNGQAVLTFKETSRDIWNKVGSAWKNATNAFVKQGSTWKECTEVYVKKNGVWKKSLTKGGSLNPSFTTDSTDWGGLAYSNLAPVAPVTTTQSSYIAGVPSGGCGPRIAFGNLPTTVGNRRYDGYAPVLKNFDTENGANPTKNIVFKGSAVTADMLPKFGIDAAEFDNIPTVYPLQIVTWSFSVIVDHVFSFGFFIWSNPTGATAGTANYYNVWEQVHPQGGRQSPSATDKWRVPVDFPSNGIIVAGFGDVYGGCPTGLHNLTITCSVTTY